MAPIQAKRTTATGVSKVLNGRKSPYSQGGGGGKGSEPPPPQPTPTHTACPEQLPTRLWDQPAALPDRSIATMCVELPKPTAGQISVNPVMHDVHDWATNKNTSHQTILLFIPPYTLHKLTHPEYMTLTPNHNQSSAVPDWCSGYLSMTLGCSALCGSDVLQCTECLPNIQLTLCPFFCPMAHTPSNQRL